MDNRRLAATECEAWPDPLKKSCAGRCAKYGEPPCWKLPMLVSPCPDIVPCDECLADETNGAAMSEEP